MNEDNSWSGCLLKHSEHLGDVARSSKDSFPKLRWLIIGFGTERSQKLGVLTTQDVGHTMVEVDVGGRTNKSSRWMRIGLCHVGRKEEKKYGKKR
jgi:hypothetical protein